VATWVIGDIHGCWRTLQRLLERIRWDPSADELWLVGDLVNRGPSSLEVLRWAVVHDERITAVMGNHDLHLLSRAAGLRPPRSGDRLDEVLAAPDREALLGWIRRQPFLHRQASMVMVHAGLWPGWSVAEAEDLARSISARLDELLPRLNARPRPVWGPELDGDERLAAAAAIFTLVRTVRSDGRPRLGFTGHPDRAPAGSRPWFETARAIADGSTVIFGHWAMLGAHDAGGARCLDTGCVYGGSLTASPLEGGEPIRQELIDRVDSEEV
jgi:bis(5'-nucleosyl)-tetraphosphatase (symmetrical)